jgi:hypothetical protein
LGAIRAGCAPGASDEPDAALHGEAALPDQDHQQQRLVDVGGLRHAVAGRAGGCDMRTARSAVSLGRSDAPVDALPGDQCGDRDDVPRQAEPGVSRRRDEQPAVFG